MNSGESESYGRKSSSGSGYDSKKTVIRNGKEYTYWEARYTSGFDPGTGKQIQRSISGKTQKEVSQKLKAVTTAIDSGTYRAPNKMTVGEWLDIWANEYLGAVKPRTVDSYKSAVKNQIKPAMGAIRLESLNAHTIQGFYNSLSERLSAKTVKNTHGILHKALQQAVANGYIHFNPADACIIPRAVRKELHPLDEVQISSFLQAIKGHRFETLFTFTLFTGMREGEVLGLTWDAVDFNKGIVLINKQVQKERRKDGEYRLVTTKNSRGRSITLAPFVRSLLKEVHRQQLEWRLQNVRYWNNPMNLVFTDEAGNHLMPHTVYHRFKAVVEAIGCPDVRFHDLRHSYAVAAIRAGDDVKTVQENLGHATASFTLDICGHVTEQMKQASASRMEQFIHSVRSS